MTGALVAALARQADLPGGRIPDFSGAACLGLWDLFDEGGVGEPAEKVSARHDRAVALCRACPVLDACKVWASGLPSKKRPPGVLAGRRPWTKQDPAAGGGRHA
ncbi:hypothetical protein GOHSU_68_00120 [Gordonia hirsuta DSM 44140 = NBRC 16056]|uniref:4Fe-4S Wbl-type domain-containing protein n=1 Tax=Gordonia hirsuta DSM 44140 = NBRC 16056 TaxID=1121927 RepID=L7LD29_9ACTN|nr:hypothetical protein [Gordonia hirsuta]GAC59020.1 hypothetical protein GOHSU_68_00120 [Gordonia hirsuta DSM 44140 = NBRC 16056]